MRARVALTPELIVDAASRLAENAGADALSIRALGKELGVDPTAVYRHFRDRDQIVLEVADRLLSGIVDGLPADLEWRARLEWLAQEVVRSFVAHPAIAPILALRTTRRQGEFRLAEAILGALREAGLSDERAAVQHRVFDDTVMSYAAMISAYTAMDESSREGDESAWSREYRALPVRRYPNIAAVAQHFSGIEDETVLQELVSALLDRVEKLAATE
ncbi:TetR/AcrR family transcriptional regulator [Actinoplanes sp. NPDC023936]|uniref:TetR/AcrR family transcriptional regulator n=1 Tax=Actinoplanes sp. NPDC023936 TaxID=3154910 RepID=UPI0033BFF3FB